MSKNRSAQSDRARRRERTLVHARLQRLQRLLTVGRRVHHEAVEAQERGHEAQRERGVVGEQRVQHAPRRLGRRQPRAAARRRRLRLRRQVRRVLVSRGAQRGQRGIRLAVGEHPNRDGQRELRAWKRVNSDNQGLRALVLGGHTHLRPLPFLRLDLQRAAHQARKSGGDE